MEKKPLVAKMEKNANDFTISINPATGKEIGISEIHTTGYLNQAVVDGSRVQKIWATVPIQERIAKIKKIARYIVDNADGIAEVISRDNGKTRVDALATEVLAAAMAIHYYCRKAPRFLKPKSTGTGNLFLINKRSKIFRIPYGVVGIISPWNYPFAIPISEVVMALLAGNAVVLKIATETQQVGLALKRAVEFANLPNGLFTYVNLPGKITADAFLSAGINKIFFTGSVPVGKYIMEKAAKTLTPVCLELGGNDAMIVCEDADPYRAAKGALWAGFQNAGQSCGGVERIYVHEKIYDNFMKELKKNIENLRIGISDNFDCDMGCLTTDRQAEIVRLHIEDALEKGATIYAQSTLPEGLNSRFIPATVLTNVNHSMLVMKEETFGPVVGVMKFSDYNAAIKLANDSNLGLTASVWSRNQKFAAKIGREIKAGVIMINDHLMSHGLAETPWGGFKESGIGRTHGKLGFDEMTQPMVVVKDFLSFTKKQLWWHPYSRQLYDGLLGILELLYGKKFSVKFKGFKKLIKILPRIFTK